jgi:hypothetical protein
MSAANALTTHPFYSTALPALVPTNMDEAIRLARAMADAKLVPKHLQGDVGSCLMIVEQAMRWRMSPFAVAQCTSSIGGKLMYEGKLVAAAVESSGQIEGHFDYKFSGEGEELKVTVSARRRGEQNDRQLTIALKDVRTGNEWWKKQPEQQLSYSGARAWSRRYTPSAMLGIYSPEEIDRRTGRTIDGDPVIEEPESPRDKINKDVPLGTAPKMTLRQWLDDFEARCAAAHSEEVAEAILKEERVLRLDDPDLQINESARRRALDVRKEMVERIWPPGDKPEDDDWTETEKPAA